MLRGHSALNLDAKGRLAIPTKYRGYLLDLCEGKLMVTVDRDSLLIYPLNEWEVIERKLLTLPNLDPRTRDLQRLLIGYATEVELDGNGRVLLPGPIREFAKLDKRVVLLGQGNKFELWDEDKWNSHSSSWIERTGGESGLTSDLENLSL